MWALGIRLLGFRVKGFWTSFGLELHDLGIEAWSLGFRVQGLGFTVQGLGWCTFLESEDKKSSLQNVNSSRNSQDSRNMRNYDDVEIRLILVCFGWG